MCVRVVGLALLGHQCDFSIFVFFSFLVLLWFEGDVDGMCEGISFHLVAGSFSFHLFPLHVFPTLFCALARFVLASAGSVAWPCRQLSL